MNPILPLLVAWSSWFTPSPRHAYGLIVNYGNQHIIEANAAYRGYDLSYYPDRCAGSAISRMDIGKLFWLKLPDGTWYGGCLFVDVGARHDFPDQIERGEIAELPDWMMDKLGVFYSAWGEIYIGQCPPLSGQPQRYSPELIYRNDTAPYVPFPPQDIQTATCRHDIIGD